MLEGRSLTVENFYEQYEPLAPVTPSEAEQKEIDSITEKLENMDRYVEMHTNIEAQEVHVYRMCCVVIVTETHEVDFFSVNGKSGERTL